MKIRSYIHVIVQFASIFFILFSEPAISRRWFLVPGIAGLSLALWAIWAMRKSVLSAMPDPQPNASIIKKGPYKHIRHPMYASLFLILIPIVVCFPSKFRIVVLIIFTINQLMKMYYEEKLLVKLFPEYKNYMEKTKRLIPYVF